MAESRKIRSHDKNSFTDRQSVALVKTIFAAQERIADNINTNDNWPNIDGTIDIQDKVQEKQTDSAQIVAKFTVQVKTLEKSGVLKFVCPVELLEYCKKLEDVLLLVADNANKKIYWMYLDPLTVNKVDNGTNTSTVTLQLTDKQCFSETDDSYIGEWVSLFNEKRSRIGTLEERVDDLLNSEIDVSKQLLEKYRYTEALEYLLDLKQRRWDQANDYARFRILSNIAAAQAHLDQVNEAATNYLAAFDFQRDLPKAHANKAIAHLLKDEYEEALREAEQVLKLNPIDISASSTKVQALMSAGKKLDEVLASIDEKAAEDPGVSYALYFAARELGDEVEAMQFLERAAGGDNKSPYIHGDLGINLLESVVNKDPRASAEDLTPQQREIVQRALSELQMAWANMTDSRDRKFHTVWLFDMVMAYRLLGLECDAERSNDDLLRLAPDNEIYIKNAAVIAFKAKKYEVAENYYRRLLKMGSSLPEISIMLADTLRAQDKTEEALKVCEEYISTHDTYSDIFVDVCQSLFDIYIELKDLDKAQDLADRLLKKSDTVTMGSLFAARVSRLKQDSESSLRYLEKAEASVNKVTFEALIWGLAEEAFWSAAYGIAARAYAKVMKPTSETNFVQRYLKSLYETHDYQQIIDFASTIREVQGASRYITQFEWGAYLQLQNLPQARKVLEDYIAKSPDDEDARLSLAIIYFRSHDLKALDAYLNNKIELEKLDLLAEAQLANLYQSRKNTKRALEIIYDLRRRHINDADAHSAYVSIFMGLESFISKIVNVKTVQPNTVLYYKGGHFVIEADYEPRLSENELSPADAEKRGFIGKQKGDLITLSENQFGGKNEVKITDVKSKYIFALHDSMQNYERRFSDRHDLMGFNVSNKDFSPLFKQLDQRQKQTQAIEDLYKQGKITIDLFAKLVGRNVIETFYALRGAPDLGVRVANGTVEETLTVNKLMQKTDNNTVLVADLTALITLFELDLSLQKIGLKKLVVAQSAKDSVLELIAQLESIGKRQSMTLYKSGGHYIRQEVTVKQQQQRISHIKKFSKWIDDNTTITAISQDQLNVVAEKTADYEKLREIVNDTQLDSVKLAIGDNRIFYSDDVGLRGLSTSTFGVNGVWTQALLAHQAETEKLDVENYKRATIDLVNHNYHYVAINPQILLYAAEMAKWQPQGPLLGVLKALSRPEISSASIVIVAVNFLYEFYKQTTLTDKSLIVNQLLNEVSRHHDKNEFIALLHRGLNISFKLMPQQLQEIRTTITAWENLHNF